MLHREWLANGGIRFGRFFLRLFKRLTPALALLVSLTVVISFVALSPLGSLQVAGRAGLGAILLTANFEIVRITGAYFDALAETNPHYLVTHPPAFLSRLIPSTTGRT